MKRMNIEIDKSNNESLYLLSLLDNREFTWKLVERVLSFVATANFWSKAIFYFSFTHSMFVFPGDRIFQIFLSICYLFTQPAFCRLTKMNIEF